AESSRFLVGQAAAPADHGHAERASSRAHLASDSSEPDEAEGPAVESLRLAVLLLVPDALREVGGVLGDPAVESEDQSERELRDRDRVLARAVRDVDSPLRSRFDVDRVVAGA